MYTKHEIKIVDPDIILKYTKELQQIIPDYQILAFKKIFYSSRPSQGYIQVLLKCSNPSHPGYWADLRAVRRGSRCKVCSRQRLRQKEEGAYTIDDVKVVIANVLPEYQVLNIERRLTAPPYGHRWFVQLQCSNPDHPPYWTQLSCASKKHICKKCAYNPENLTPQKKKRILEACEKNHCVFLDIISCGAKSSKNLKIKVQDEEGFLFVVTLDSLRWDRSFKKEKRFTGNPYVMENIIHWCALYRPDYRLLSTAFRGMDEIYDFYYAGDELVFSRDSDRVFQASLSGFIYSFTKHPLFRASGNTYGVRLVSKFLQQHYVEYLREKTFYGLLSSKGANMYFDFYIPDHNTVIEVDGRQHFVPVKRFGGIQGFEDTRARDKIKDKYCETHNINLIRLPFYLFGSERKPCADYVYVLLKQLNLE